jgi:predicted alpha/beta hydrolase family esterase
VLLSPDVVLVHGYTGSGPQHWQTWLAGRLTTEGRQVRYPQLPDDADPELEAWLGTLQQALAPSCGARTVLAHSLGCWLWVHAVGRGVVPPADRLLLVAPPAPAWVAAELPRFPAATWAELADTVRGREATVVIGQGDEFLPVAERAELSAAVPGVVEIPGGGHLNTASGFGPWPAVRAWVDGDPGPLRDTPR